MFLLQESETASMEKFVLILPKTIWRKGTCTAPSIWTPVFKIIQYHSKKKMAKTFVTSVIEDKIISQLQINDLFVCQSYSCLLSLKMFA